MKSTPDSPFVVRQEPDAIDRTKVRRNAFIGIFAFAASLAITFLYIRVEGAARPAGAARPPPAPSSTVETTLILATERGLTLRTEQRAALDHYGWVDRDAGIARIPIERAMELIADGGTSQ